jgi:hypothetical protein
MCIFNLIPGFFLPRLDAVGMAQCKNAASIKGLEKTRCFSGQRRMVCIFNLITHHQNSGKYWNFRKFPLTCDIFPARGALCVFYLIPHHQNSGKYWKIRKFPLTCDIFLARDALCVFYLNPHHQNSGKYWKIRKFPLTWDKVFHVSIAL